MKNLKSLFMTIAVASLFLFSLTARAQPPNPPGPPVEPGPQLQNLQDQIDDLQDQIDDLQNQIDGASISGYEQIQSDTVVIAAGAIEFLTLYCPADKYPLGGGYNMGNYLLQVVISQPASDINGQKWLFEVKNTDSVQHSFWGYVICANLSD